MAQEAKTKDLIPFWLAVAITVMVALPFGIWLSKWNLPIWVSFVVWAEYFALGAKPKALMTMVPAYALGAFASVAILTFYAWLNSWLTHQIRTPGDIALYVSFFVGFSFFIYWMKWLKVTQGPGGLPYFNGITMVLAVFFTGAFLTPFPADVHFLLVPTLAGLGAILGGALGAFLGWFNVTIEFPHVVPAKPAVEARPPTAPAAAPPAAVA